jgi:hypothetical protein
MQLDKGLFSVKVACGCELAVEIAASTMSTEELNRTMDVVRQLHCEKHQPTALVQEQPVLAQVLSMRGDK